MHNTATRTLEETSVEKPRKASWDRSLKKMPSGLFSRKTRIEVDDEEYDALLAFMADPQPRECPDALKKAIRDELIRMERTKGA